MPDIINVISVEGSLFILIATLVSAFIIGLIALKILIRVLESGRLYLFSGYCIFVGVITLILTI